MRHSIRIIKSICLFLLLMLLVQCSPQTAAQPEPAQVNSPEQPEPSQPEMEEVPATETSEPTEAVPTVAPEPTAVPPTEVPTPVITVEWTKHASSGAELSFSHPGEWIGPAQLPFGEGVYVKHPEQEVGMILQLELSGDPLQLLADWGTGPVEITGLVSFTPESVVDGEVVTISRLEASTRIAEGQGLRAQTAFLRRPQDVMQFIWYAPVEQWDEMQEVFTRLLVSLEIWQKHIDQGLHTMYLHDWSVPVKPVDADGLWFQSQDGVRGMVLKIGEVADPAALLGAWSPESLASLGLNECSLPEPAGRVKGVGGEWESMQGECQNANGEATLYQVAILPDKDRVLEMVQYAPTSQWEYAVEIFSIMQDMLIDIR